MYASLRPLVTFKIRQRSVILKETNFQPYTQKIAQTVVRFLVNAMFLAFSVGRAYLEPEVIVHVIHCCLSSAAGKLQVDLKELAPCNVSENDP